MSKELEVATIIMEWGNIVLFGLWVLGLKLKVFDKLPIWRLVTVSVLLLYQSCLWLSLEDRGILRQMSNDDRVILVGWISGIIVYIIMAFLIDDKKGEKK